MEDTIIPIIRTGFSFILLVLVTLLIGKHINTHKNHYSFALSVTIGSFIANMGFDTKLNFFEMLLSFITLLVMFYFFLILSSRSRQLRKWLSGRPTVLIEEGKILEENMKKLKFSIDDLNQQLREKSIFNVEEVEYALLEVSGELSILKKEKFQTTTRKDFHFYSTKKTLPVELIMDGSLIRKNTDGKYSASWIINECKKRNLQVEDVYYAVVNSDGYLFIDTYKDRITSPVDLESLVIC